MTYAVISLFLYISALVFVLSIGIRLWKAEPTEKPLRILAAIIGAGIAWPLALPALAWYWWVMMDRDD